MKKSTFREGFSRVKGAVIAGSFVASTAFLSAKDIFGTGDDASIDVSPIFYTASLIITAIASIWAIKKVIALGNKS